MFNYLDYSDDPGDLDFELCRGRTEFYVHARETSHFPYLVACVKIDVTKGYDEYFDDMLPTLRLELALSLALDEIYYGMKPLTFEVEEL
jgi:hypothetical protein